MTIGLGHYLSVAAILFTFGIFGIFLNRKNVIVILMSIELILLAVNINFVAFSTHLGDIMGQVFALLVLTVPRPTDLANALVGNHSPRGAKAGDVARVAHMALGAAIRRGKDIARRGDRPVLLR